jgi:hypothetical protein
MTKPKRHNTIHHTLNVYTTPISTNKYGDHFGPRYDSPLTGKLERIPRRITGHLPTQEAADAWIAANFDGLVGRELKILERQSWRDNTNILRIYTEFAAFRKEQIPKSADQDLSMLSNFGIPYFLTVAKEHDANKWWRHNRALHTWLRTEAFTEQGKLIAPSSANKVINSLNHFLKWMRGEIIEWENFRPFECIRDTKRKLSTEEAYIMSDEFEAIATEIGRSYGKLYEEMYRTQFEMGARVGEMLAIAFHNVSDKVPEALSKHFESVGYKVHGVVILECQPKEAYLSRDSTGSFPKKPLKWRPEISIDHNRTVPICNEAIWDMLIDRHLEQADLFDEKKFGHEKRNYLIFDGAQRGKYLDAIREASEKLGYITKGSHACRHTRSTIWTNDGIDAKLSELTLGHKAASHEKYVHAVGLMNAEAERNKPTERLQKRQK